MTRTIRILTLLAAMIITAGQTAWSESIDPSNLKWGTMTGGVICFCSNEACTSFFEGDVAGGTTVYIVAQPESGYTGVGVEFTAEETVGSGGAQAPRRTPGIGNTINVDAVEGKPGIYKFTMPSSGNNVTVSATFPEKAKKTVSYIDPTKEGDAQNCSHEAYVLDGSEWAIGNDGETWYVCNSDLDYNHTVYFFGDLYLILGDGANMTINTTERPNNAQAILGQDACLTIYGQSTNNMGSLSATGNNEAGIRAYNANITINGGKVTATGTGDNAIGISADNITINGGNITATGTGYGIRARVANGTITLGGGTVTASSYYGTVNLTCGYRNADRTKIIPSGNNIKFSDYEDVTIYPDVTVNYIDKNGETKTVASADYKILEGTETTLAVGWYVVNSDVTYSGNLKTDGYGDVNIILCDGKTLAASSIEPNGHAQLNIYGQSQGTGTATFSGDIEASDGFKIYGGNITANGRITSPAGSIFFYGGSVTATGKIESGDHFIYFFGGTVTAGSYSADEKIIITDGWTYTDGSNAYSGTLYDNNTHANGHFASLDALNTALGGQTLRPANILVTPSEHGSVVPNTYYAAENATVTLTVTPDDGYRLKSISATGVTLAAVDNQPTKRTFSMPAAAVTITASWEEKTQEGATTEVTENVDIVDANNATVTSVEVGAETTSITISGTVSDGTNEVPITSIANGVFTAENTANVKSLDLSLTAITLTGDARDANGPLANVDENTIIYLPATASATGVNVVKTDGSSAEIKIGEGKSFINSKGDITTKKFSFDRIFLTGENQLNTVFLPVNAPAAVAATFGTFYTCSSVDANGAVLSVVTGDLTANTAYVFKPASGKSQIAYEGSETLTIKVNANITNPTGAGLKGTNVKGTISLLATDATKAYGYAAETVDGATVGAFYKLKPEATVPAYRGWLEVEDASSPQLAIIIEGEGTTSIRSIDGVPVNEGTYYDLNGRQLSAQPTKPGLYINNGKKVVIK